MSVLNSLHQNSRCLAAVWGVLIASATITGCSQSDQEGALAIQSDRDGNSEIYTIDLSSGKRTRLSDSEGGDWTYMDASPKSRGVLQFFP